MICSNSNNDDNNNNSSSSNNNNNNNNSNAKSKNLARCEITSHIFAKTMLE